MEYVTLNNGVEMPILGFGVFSLNLENMIIREFTKYDLLK